MADLERNPDFEIRQILQCLKTNGYELEDVEDSDEMEGMMRAIFKKDVGFSEMDGNYVNDAFIKIKIDFDSRFDYKNNVKNEDEEGEIIYDYDANKARDFIEQLMDGNYGGGKRRRRKTRKNRKNRRK
jgi:hypothetical protein